MQFIFVHFLSLTKFSNGCMISSCMKVSTTSGPFGYKVESTISHLLYCYRCYSCFPSYSYLSGWNYSWSCSYMIGCNFILNCIDFEPVILISHCSNISVAPWDFGSCCLGLYLGLYPLTYLCSCWRLSSFWPSYKLDLRFWWTSTFLWSQSSGQIHKCSLHGLASFRRLRLRQLRHLIHPVGFSHQVQLLTTSQVFSLE